MVWETMRSPSGVSVFSLDTSAKLFCFHVESREKSTKKRLKMRASRVAAKGGFIPPSAFGNCLKNNGFAGGQPLHSCATGEPVEQ